MSAICGIVRFDGQAVAERDLARQMRLLAARGPDGARLWRDHRAGLCSLLLRVTAEDGYDRQPLVAAQRDLVLVSDARLDNREELAEKLSLPADGLAQMADSAIILEAFKRWGGDCAEHLLGDFAFAVWDAKAATLTLARDHMGQRNIFYHAGEGFFAFATEIKALWTLGEVPRVLDERRLLAGLAFAGVTPEGETIFPGISGIRGGSILTLDARGTIASRSYWEPHADPAHLGRDEAYYIKAYRDVLGEAVACRLRRATAPAGLLMSGGFDTGAIAGLAGAVLAPRGRKMIAVSSVMPEDYRGRIPHARKWVELCRRHMPHLDVRYITRDGLDVFTGLEQNFLATDRPHSPNRYANDALYAEVARAGARVVMNGFGGDYTLNPRGQRALVRLLLAGRMREFLREFAAMRRHTGEGFLHTLRRDVVSRLVPPSWRETWLRFRTGLRLSGATHPLSPQHLGSNGLLPRTGRRPGESMHQGMARVLSVQQRNLAMPGALAAAAHGLELTQPFHDKRVVELGLAIPEDLFLKNGRTRHLARQALKDLYPPEFQDRPPGNDDTTPDFLAMVKRVEPRILAEIARMEKTERLAQHFDFPRMRRMLTRRTLERHATGTEVDTRQAVVAFLMARYLEWFRRDNA